MKKTAIAPSNIAFVKYWGKKDERLRLPANGSLSMNLSGMTTTTTVEFSPLLSSDDITVNGVKEPTPGSRVVPHLDKVRALSGLREKARVVSNNTFPVGTGLSSSASGFAALSVAAASASGMSLSQKELSILARQGSGSACRSIPDGFVEWLDGDTSEASYAVSLHPPDFWDIVDVVAVVSSDKKQVSSTGGQTAAATSPFYKTRIQGVNETLTRAKEYLAGKDFPAFGELVEADALNMHAVMLTSTPSLIYWTQGTLAVMKLVALWRRQGLPVYFTINTGQDVHVLAEGKNAERVTKLLHDVDFVKDVIVNKPAPGAKLIDNHLF